MASEDVTLEDVFLMFANHGACALAARLASTARLCAARFAPSAGSHPLRGVAVAAASMPAAALPAPPDARQRPRHAGHTHGDDHSHLDNRQVRPRRRGRCGPRAWQQLLAS
mmetsp:Transcript_13674/g.47687  ORF Transcript_13674/g.47687 Transcript_13674/m.47687 type:complete len:111 (+) Transcript_13674:376-708(+)